MPLEDKPDLFPLPPSPLGEDIVPIEDVEAAVLELILGVAASHEAKSLEHGPDGIESHWDTLDYLKTAMDVPQAVEAVTARLVEWLRREGYTWAELAEAAGMKGPATAHHRWGAGREQRLEALRLRTGGRTTTSGRQPLPGRSAAEAAKILGCDPRTLPSRVKAGELQSAEVALSTGATRTRYFLPGDLMP